MKQERGSCLGKEAAGGAGSGGDYSALTLALAPTLRGGWEPVERPGKGTRGKEWAGHFDRTRWGGVCEGLWVEALWPAESRGRFSQLPGATARTEPLFFQRGASVPPRPNLSCFFLFLHYPLLSPLFSPPPLLPLSPPLSLPLFPNDFPLSFSFSSSVSSKRVKVRGRVVMQLKHQSPSFRAPSKALGKVPAVFHMVICFCKFCRSF